MPPLAPIGLGEGRTPSFRLESAADEIGLDVDLFLKDESQNPTWSQKDRLARCVVSAAVRSDTRGVVASSTGNHGAAVSAYAARAGLEAIVVTAPETPAAVTRFIGAYGGTVLAVPDEDVRRRTVDRLADRGYHPVSTRTPVHTGHPVVPRATRRSPTNSIAIWGECRRSSPCRRATRSYCTASGRGVRELEQLDVADETPCMLACEPAARGPLREALAADDPIASVAADPTEAYSIAATTSSVRGRRAVAESGGAAIGFTAADLASAEGLLAHGGTWQESAGAAGIAGLARAVADGRKAELGLDDGPIVAIATSSGFKNGEGRAQRVPRTGERRAERPVSDEVAHDLGTASGERQRFASDERREAPRVDPDWESIESALIAAGHLDG